MLMNYGFCFPNNHYDSYAVRLKMKVDPNDLFVPHLVDYKGDDFTQEIRLKNN